MYVYEIDNQRKAFYLLGQSFNKQALKIYRFEQVTKQGIHFSVI